VVAESFVPEMLWALVPEIGLLVIGTLVLVFDVLWKDNRRRNLGWLTVAGLGIVFFLTLIFSRPGPQPALILGGMLRQDQLSFVFQLLFLAGGALTALFAMDTDGIGRRGEFYLLMLASTLGMCLMAGAADLVMLFLAIEMTSIPLYALAGFLIRDYKSTESGFKYFLFGAATSAVMLYGMSLLYGFSGTTQIYQITRLLVQNQTLVFPIMAVLVLILVGFGFKTSIFPFHFWAPDVYEGSPTPVAGFLSTASKAAGFAVLIRFLMAILGEGTIPSMVIVLAILSSATMVIGNVLALAQKNIKRLLAYSSIAQAGYMLIGVAVGTDLGITATIFYLVTYLLTNLAAFGVVTVVGKTLGSDEISCYAGLSRRSPGLALALLVSFLSLGGIPPFGGFVAKVLVFASAVHAATVNPLMLWLAIIGILNSIIALYYYLTVLKVAYLYRTSEEGRPLTLSRPWVIALTVCVAGVILLGTFFAPWFNWSQAAAVSLF